MDKLPIEVMIHILGNLPLPELLEARLTNKQVRGAIDTILKDTYLQKHHVPLHQVPDIRVVIADLKGSFVNLTSDLARINSDFGRWPDTPKGKIYFNTYGLFRKGGHIVSLYQGTNAGLYWALQCETDGCPGNGRKVSKCPLEGLPRTAETMEALCLALLSVGFRYQLITSQYGIITYFDGPHRYIHGALGKRRQILLPILTDS